MLSAAIAPTRLAECCRRASPRTRRIRLRAVRPVVGQGHGESRRRPEYTADKSRERWRGARTLHGVHRPDDLLSRRSGRSRLASPVRVHRYSWRVQERARVRGAAGASAARDWTGAAGASGTGAGARCRGRQRGTAPSDPPLISATPFMLRDPKSIPKRQWLYGHHLIRKFGSATIAPGGIGKSSLLIVEALAIVTGRALLGIMPTTALPGSGSGMAKTRTKKSSGASAAACLHFGITPLEIEGGLFVDSGRSSEIVIATQTRNGATIAVPDGRGAGQTISDNQIDVVQIDPFISSHRVTENDNNAIDLVAKTWTGIADVTNTRNRPVRTIPARPAVPK